MDLHKIIIGYSYDFKDIAFKTGKKTRYLYGFANVLPQKLFMILITLQFEMKKNFKL